VSEGTVIFPNKFQQDNLLVAGKETEFPGKDARFQFRLKDPGPETVIAICNATGKQADGIKHDFETRSFTPLGNYPKFLTPDCGRGRAEGRRGSDAESEEQITDAKPNPGSDCDQARRQIVLKFWAGSSWWPRTSCPAHGLPAAADCSVGDTRQKHFTTPAKLHNARLSSWHFLLMGRTDNLNLVWE
jgi:hypothetical protein